MKTTTHGWKAAGVFGLTGLVLGGCALPSDPTISVVEVRLTDQTPEASVVLFTLEARNDNDDVVPLREIDYQVSVGGRSVFSASRSPEVSVPAKGVQRFTVPATIGAAPGGAELGISGEVTYLSPGLLAEVLFDQGLRRPSTDFRGTARLGAP